MAHSWNNVLIGGDRAYVSKAEAEALLDARDTLLRDMADVLRRLHKMPLSVEVGGRPGEQIAAGTICPWCAGTLECSFDCRLADVLRRAGEIRPT